MTTAIECLECQRLAQNMETASRLPDTDDYKKAVAAYEAHRDAAHPESIDERLDVELTEAAKRAGPENQNHQTGYDIYVDN